MKEFYDYIGPNYLLAIKGKIGMELLPNSDKLIV